jgi:hypothetical protein
MSTQKLIHLECIYLGGYYPKALKANDSKSYRELRFTNGRATVSEAEFEILKDYLKYGREIAKLGELRNPATLKMTQVIRGKGPIDTLREQLKAEGEPKPPPEADDVPETPEETLARLAAEHDETTNLRGHLKAQESQAKKRGRPKAVTA